MTKDVGINGEVTTFQLNEKLFCSLNFKHKERKDLGNFEAENRTKTTSCFKCDHSSQKLHRTVNRRGRKLNLSCQPRVDRRCCIVVELLYFCCCLEDDFIHYS